VGVAVGVFIIWSGFGLVRETAAPLIGRSASPETVKRIKSLVMSHEGALGTHDIIVHEYGPQHVFATVHIEVDSREDIFKSHAMVDDIEEEAREKYGMVLVGHMDPVDTQNPLLAELRELIWSVVESVDGALDFHDLRVVTLPSRTNVIFDVVISHDHPEQTSAEIKKKVDSAFAKKDPALRAIINTDYDYAAGA
jgi:divalent metal cation (Fe/Co/Zn/Cd) transporter